MKKGDKIDCPACHHQTVVKEKVEMDGWKVGDKIFVCAFCGAKIGDKADEETKEKLDKKAVSGLAALFDEELEEGPVITEEEGDRHFCKYCEHYVFHAFVERCHLHNREVTPMHSCPDFKAKNTDKKESKDNDGGKSIF